MVEVVIGDKTYIIGECILFICLTVWTGREVGDVIDKQNRDVGGNPCFLKISDKWRWLFRFQKKLYTDKFTILRASVILHLLGYLSAIIEFMLFIIALITNNLKIISVVPQIYFTSTIFGMLCVFFPDSIRYFYYMHKSYQYDWITDFKEQLVQNSKRRCKVVSKLDDNTFEITLGRLGKKKFRASADVPVEVGDEKVAVHVYHSLDENAPFWVIKNF